MDIDRSADAAVAAALVNTGREVWGEDRLARPGDLGALLAEHGVDHVADLSESDLRAARALRDRLRRAFTSVDEPAVVADLNALLVETGTRPQLVGHGSARWWTCATAENAAPVQRLGSAAALGLLALIQRDGLARLGRCAAHGCAGVFVDTTRNRSRRYCIPEICGNRTNLAAFRARRRGERPAGSRHE